MLRQWTQICSMKKFLTQNRLRYTAIHWILWCSSLFLKDVIFPGKIDLHTDVDVSALDLIKNARDMILFSRAVQHAAKDTLFEIEKEVIAIDRKNEALDNAKTAKQESTSDRVDDILQDLIKLKFSQDQILALKQAVVAAAQNGEHNIQHWVSVRYSPDELQHISSLVADYYAQSVIEHLKQNVQAIEVQDNSADTMT